MSRRVTCTYHCSRCQGHFHSERAFDVHRDGFECIEPLDDGRFTPLTNTGKCELSQHAPYTLLEEGNMEVFPEGWRAGDPKLQRVLEPVTVWTLGANLEQARQYFSGDGRGVDRPEEPVLSADYEPVEAQDGHELGEGASRPPSAAEASMRRALERRKARAGT